MYFRLVGFLVIHNLHRKKREAYRGSEFAARVIASKGLPVVMKVSLLDPRSSTWGTRNATDELTVGPFRHQQPLPPP